MSIDQLEIEELEMEGVEIPQDVEFVWITILSTYSNSWNTFQSYTL